MRIAIFCAGLACISATAHAIRGPVGYSGCTPDQRRILGEAVALGNWLTNTPEFENGMRTGRLDTERIQWRRTNGEGSGRTMGSAIASTRSVNSVLFTCADLGADRSRAAFRSSLLTRRELITLHGRFLNDALAMVRFQGQVQIAAAIWHELMHQQGFSSSHPRPDSAGRTHMALYVERVLGDVATHIVRRRWAYLGNSSGPSVDTHASIIEAAMAGGGIRSSLELDWAIPQSAPRRLMVFASQACVQMAANSSAVLQSECVVESAAQQWVSVYLMGSATRIILADKQTGTCVDVPDGDPATHTVLQGYSCHAGTSQQFLLRPSGQIEAVADDGGPTGQCLDVPNGSAADNVALQLYPCHTASAANQRFDWEIGW